MTYNTSPYFSFPDIDPIQGPMSGSVTTPSIADNNNKGYYGNPERFFQDFFLKKIDFLSDNGLDRDVDPNPTTPGVSSYKISGITVIILLGAGFLLFKGKKSWL